MTPDQDTPIRSRARTAIALIAAVSLAALASADMFALTTRNVALAGMIAPWSGATKSKRAELLVQNSRGPQDAPAITAAAKAALRAEPYDFEAARDLATMAIFRGDERLGRTLFTAIGGATLREPSTHVWLMADAYKAGDTPAFMREAEVVLRTRPDISAQVLQLFTRLVDRGLFGDSFVRRLAERPEWRPAFFDVFGENSTNSAAAFDLYRKLLHTVAPANRSELRVWLRHQVGTADAETVVRQWRELQRPPLGAREALLRDPDMEGSVAPQPFDWTFYTPASGFSEIDASPEGKGNALYVEMSGRDSVGVVRQILDLAPGTYRMSYRVYPLADLSRKILRLSLYCAQGKNFAPLADQAVDAAPEMWSARAWTFTVPAGCNVQSLWIGMSPNDLSAELRAYFDDFSLTRAPSRPAAPAAVAAGSAKATR